MIAAILTALLMPAVPVALVWAGGTIMMRVTGRARFRQRRREPKSVPLNFRLRGYDSAAANDYWKWLGPEGVSAELRFLWADMLFPFWYAAALVGSLYAGWRVLEFPLSPLLPAIPVAIAVVADWAENAIHIRQIGRFKSGLALDDRQIRLASLATSVKLVFFWLSTALVVALAVWVLLAGARGLALAAPNPNPGE